MTIIDLSHYLHAGMPVYPGTESPVLTESSTIENDNFREKKLTFYSHTGTHLDAPAHIAPGAPTLDQLPLETFYGSAFVFDWSGTDKAIIDLSDLLPHAGEIGEHEFLILFTGWDKHWGDPQYFSGYPVLSERAARWLADLGLKGIGMDSISADPMGASELTIHTILLSAGMVIVENLAHLDALPKAPFMLACFPLKIKDADGSPARVVAMVP